jgi:hypothetical protein
MPVGCLSVTLRKVQKGNVLAALLQLYLLQSGKPYINNVFGFPIKENPYFMFAAA